MLETLLQVTLDLALGLPDAAGHLPQAADENPAEQDEKRGDQHQQCGEPPVHRAQEHDGGDHLDHGGEYLRNIGHDDVRDRAHVGLEAVHGVTRMALLLSQPFGIQEVGVEAFPDDEVHLGVGQVLHPHVDGGEDQPEDDDGENGRRVQAQASRRIARGDIHQPLAQENENQVQAHVQRAEQDVQQDRSPCPHGVRPKPTQVFENGFHPPIRRSRFPSTGRTGPRRPSGQSHGLRHIPPAGGRRGFPP